MRKGWGEVKTWPLNVVPNMRNPTMAVVKTLDGMSVDTRLALEIAVRGIPNLGALACELVKNFGSVEAAVTAFKTGRVVVEIVDECEAVSHAGHH